MPEYPDIVVYVERLEAHAAGKILEGVRLVSPFVLRTADPPIQSVVKQKVRGFRRIGKRIVWEFPGGLFLVMHLMIAGRLRWKAKGVKVPRRYGLAAFDFEDGSLLFTEAGSKKRASMHVVRGEDALAEHDPGGLEVLDASLEEFRERLTLRNHTVKRALTDPRLFSGIGNAYSDEILHRARLTPLKWTTRLTDDETARLYDAIRETLLAWADDLRREVGDGFPDKVTAFRKGMAVHGRYGEPCPVCETKVQRIKYASNECNYCPRCQTGGKLLADRSLSRLLKGDWPKTIEELEEGRFPS
ncbi:MAG: formamidopyrimidine-DNA glycosylase [Gemmatimonadetes bacterium]|nr:formamidopyrimidine-DNA glycosylase [Gemmatimonadota bacterium]